MTRIDAAITRVGQVEFTVVSVRPSATATTAESKRTIAGLTRYFPGRPIVLASKHASQIKYVGRPDLTRFLAKTEVTRLPWKTYTFSD